MEKGSQLGDERRWSLRKPRSTSVVLNCGAYGLYCGRAKDINMEGMFVETRRDTALPHGFSVRVHVMLGGSSRPSRLDAKVVHVTDEGVGVMFEAGDPSLYRHLARSLYDRKA